MSGVSGARAVAVGEYHSCAVLQGGSASCWGNNANGQLGDGTTNTAMAPVSVTSLSDAVDVGLGFQFSCAVRTGGGVACWGYGASGRLGNGSVSDRHTPVAVSGLP